MATYKSYHTGVKTCYSLGLENDILPDSFTETIPKSTSFYWKRENTSQKYIGGELVSKIENDFEDVKTLLDQRIARLRKGFIAFARLYLTIINFIGKDNFQKIIKDNRNSVVNFIENLPDGFPFSKKELFMLLKITPKMFDTWKRYQTYTYPQSLINLCFKRVPHQISRKEISTLLEYVNNQRYKLWSIQSIWGRAVRDKSISMSLTTFYRYCRKLGVTEKRKVPKKPRKKESVRTSKPNETWHMDVSYFKTTDNIQYYIYAVIDNFSRKIVSYTLSKKPRGAIATQTLRNAVEMEFNTKIGNKNLELVVDGGSENNNETIADFISEAAKLDYKHQLNIDKKVALKDIIFSNSVIEGMFRTLKRSYFRQLKISSENIDEELRKFVNDYNYHKPHNQHKIYTPNEIHQNPKLKEAKIVLQNANKDRIRNNKKHCCNDAMV